MKRILILYTSVGLGHKAIAENIAYHLEAAGHTIRLQDVLQAQKEKTVTGFVAIQQFINRRLPFIWQWLYQWGYIPALPLRIPAGKMHSHVLRQIIEEFGPDLVISTQTSASAPIAYLKKAGIYKNKFAIAFSDYHFHPFWLYPGTDFYLTTIPEQKQIMMERGIPAERIHYIGVTLKPKSNVDTEAVKQKFNIDEHDKVVLIGTGSLGTGASPQFVNNLVRAIKNKGIQNGILIKVIVSCGRNEEFKEALENLLGEEAIILGFYTPMRELYAITDFFVTKPGGLSIAEALLWNLPTLITHWLPGQEKLNYEYLKNKKLIMPGPKNPYDLTPEAASDIIIEELKNKSFKNSLIVNTFVAELLQTNALKHPTVTAVESSE